MLTFSGTLNLGQLEENEDSFDKCLFFPESGLFLAWGDEEEDSCELDVTELYITRDDGGDFLNVLAELDENEAIVLYQFLKKRLSHRLN